MWVDTDNRHIISMKSRGSSQTPQYNIFEFALTNMRKNRVHVHTMIIISGQKPLRARSSCDGRDPTTCGSYVVDFIVLVSCRPSFEPVQLSTFQFSIFRFLLSRWENLCINIFRFLLNRWKTVPEMCFFHSFGTASRLF